MVYFVLQITYQIISYQMQVLCNICFLVTLTAIEAEGVTHHGIARLPAKAVRNIEPVVVKGHEAAGLPGAHMHRRISTLLISLFLLLSPVSFASAEIPDFSPECPLTAVHGYKISVAPLDGSTPVPTLPVRQEKEVYRITPSVVPAFVCGKITLFGKAPPTTLMNERRTHHEKSVSIA